MEKGHYGQYTGNARHSMDHAHTKVTSRNLRATEKDDAAHMDYLKQDINYDAKHGGSDKKMTDDEKHISRLAGDLKYDKSHHSATAMHGKAHGSMAKMGHKGEGSPAMGYASDAQRKAVHASKADAAAKMNYDSAMKMNYDSAMKMGHKNPIKMGHKNPIKMGHESPVKKYGEAPLKNLKTKKGLVSSKEGSSNYMSAELKDMPLTKTATSMGRVVFGRKG